jgi:hypothetical protein
MSDAPKSWRVPLSRRSVFRIFTVTAVGAAMLRTVVGNRLAAAEAKMAQKDAHYQATPKGEQQCGNCANFEPPASCKLVEGTIVPTGWCKMYAKKAT